MIINESFYTKTDSKTVIECMKKATLETLEDLVDELKDEVPVDTGHLQKHHFRDVVESDADHIHAVIKVGEAEYWKDVQYGNRYRGANPYITRALQNVPPVPQTMEYAKKYLEVLK